MGYSQENGYVPTDLATILDSFRTNINTQFGTSYTTESFVGTNFYKYFYAIAQKYQANEIKTSEIFQYLQGYFAQINALISRPVVTNPGIIEKLALEGFTASLKKPAEVDAGKINVCVDVDDGVRAKGNITITSYANLVSGTDDVVTVAGVAFTAHTGAATPGDATFQAASSNEATAESLAIQINANATASLSVRARNVGAVVIIEAVHGGDAGNAITLAYTDNDTNAGATVSGETLADGEDNDEYEATRLEICTMLSNMAVAGCPTFGTESETIVLSNGQSFDFKYHLPHRIPVWLRLTLTLSENNQVVVGAPDAVKEALLTNIMARYRLGRNFEPQRYFSVVDAPWSAQVVLEWSTDVTEDGELAGSPTWHDEIFDAEFDELFEIDLARITLVEE